MWGSIIGGALGGVASGLLGGGKSKGPSLGKQKNHALDYDRRRIKALVDGAKDAGVHPLVALGASGGGFSPTVSVGGGSPWGDVIGDALSGFGAGVDQHYQQDADASAADDARFEQILRDNTPSEYEKLSTELLKAQIDDVRSRTALAKARASSVGGAGPSNTLVGPGGAVFSPVPGRTSAQDAEDQYGEAGDLIFGGGALLEDFAKGRVKVPGKLTNPLTKHLGDDVWFDVPRWWRETFGN